MAAEGVWRAANAGWGSQAAPLLSSQPAAPPAASPPQHESAIWSVAVTGSGSKAHARAARGATLSGGQVQCTIAGRPCQCTCSAQQTSAIRTFALVEQPSIAGHFPGEARFVWWQTEGRCSPHHQAGKNRLRCSVMKPMREHSTLHFAGDVWLASGLNVLSSGWLIRR